MSEMFSKFLLTGDKLEPELYLRQSRITYNACGASTKHF